MAYLHQPARGRWLWALLVLGLLFSPFQVMAEDDLMDTTKHPVSVTMAMQADSFFGFTPSIYGTYGLTKDIVLAFATTYWTNIQGLGVHDSNTWLELDLGPNFTFLDKRLSVTPRSEASTGTSCPLDAAHFQRAAAAGTSGRRRLTARFQV